MNIERGRVNIESSSGQRPPARCARGRNRALRTFARPTSCTRLIRRVTACKGMRYRVVPSTKRLQKALTGCRHLRGDRVLYADDGSTVTAKILQRWMVAAQKYPRVAQNRPDSSRL